LLFFDTIRQVPTHFLQHDHSSRTGFASEKRNLFLRNHITEIQVDLTSHKIGLFRPVISFSEMFPDTGILMKAKDATKADNNTYLAL
jgi:hypothetical protein